MRPWDQTLVSPKQFLTVFQLFIFLCNHPHLHLRKLPMGVHIISSHFLFYIFPNLNHNVRWQNNEPELPHVTEENCDSCIRKYWWKISWLDLGYWDWALGYGAFSGTRVLHCKHRLFSSRQQWSRIYRTLRIQNQESEERKQLLHAKILRQFHGLETNIQKHLKLIM
jgi:hypothetical protein